MAKEKDVAAFEIPYPRDGNIAIAQELCAARTAQSIKAYDLFIARHPEHPLAETARAERSRLAQAKSRQAD